MEVCALLEAADTELLWRQHTCVAQQTPMWLDQRKPSGVCRSMQRFRGVCQPRQRQVITSPSAMQDPGEWRTSARLVTHLLPNRRSPVKVLVLWWWATTGNSPSAVREDGRSEVEEEEEVVEEMSSSVPGRGTWLKQAPASCCCSMAGSRRLDAPVPKVHCSVPRQFLKLQSPHTWEHTAIKTTSSEPCYFLSFLGKKKTKRGNQRLFLRLLACSGGGEVLWFSPCIPSPPSPLLHTGSGAWLQPSNQTYIMSCVEAAARQGSLFLLPSLTSPSGHICPSLSFPQRSQPPVPACSLASFLWDCNDPGSVRLRWGTNRTQT